jgi:undecaprenyl diphosphate synthase
MDALRRAVRAALQSEIPYLTVDFRAAARYFTTNNGNWPTVDRLFVCVLEAIVNEIRGMGVDIHVSDEGGGRCFSYLNSELSGSINKYHMTMVLVLEQDARQEITEAVRRLVDEVMRGVIAPEAIDVNAISAKIRTADLPDPDLIIGMTPDQRLSNFLLWQAAYAEFYFLPIDWPDFDEAGFELAIEDYMRRHRRFGGR